MSQRVVFMGSPRFALPSLRILARTQHVIGVVTQPDRKAGRRGKIQPSPVKVLAGDLGFPVIQPVKMTEPGVLETLDDWAPDVIVVAAFGQILRPAILDLPPHGSINVHASLLPRWRGASPIQSAILEGDRETGVTLMKMDPGVDTGPILRQHSTPILADETADSLDDRLADLGAELLNETLEAYLSGRITPQPQDESEATYAPILKKSDGELDIKQSADHLARQVRAYKPWPGTFILWHNQPFLIQDAYSVAEEEIGTDRFPNMGPIVYSGQPALRTSDGILVLLEVQPAGKKSMQGHEFLRGARDWGSPAGNGVDKTDQA
jgi:methionyl-tRNA formyltransferase